MYTMHIVIVVVVSIVHNALTKCRLVSTVCVWGAALSRLIGLRQTCNLQLLLNE